MKSDVAASFDDDVLTHDQLDAMVIEKDSLDAGTTEIPHESANQVIQIWLVDMGLRNAMTKSGAEVPPKPSSYTYASLQQDANDVVTAFQQLPLADLSAERLKSRFDNSACIGAIDTATSSDATAALARLQDGEAFSAVAADESIDPNAAQSGGVLACVPAVGLRQIVAGALGETLADVYAALRPGDYDGPVETPSGYQIAKRFAFDELTADQLNALLNTPDASFLEIMGNADIKIDPIYGTFDVYRGVLSLDANQSDPALG